MKHVKRIIFLIFIVFILVISPSIIVESSSADTTFEGKGTADCPYIIHDYEDLSKLQKLVNNGEQFAGVYFVQTSDIDLNNKPWCPIGNGHDGNSFWGIYNGNGYSIKNIYVKQSQEFAGLFGYLGGQVVNLRIESGNIYGDVCGSIAAKSVGTNAVIANCINKASLYGNYVGGIAGNFYEGVIANCINFGNVHGTYYYGITAVDCDVKIYSCYVTEYEIAPSGIVPSESAMVDQSYITSKKFATKFSLTAAISRWLFLGDLDIDLLEWDCNPEPVYSSVHGITNLVYYINYFLLPSLLILFCFIYIIRYVKLKKQFSTLYKKQMYAISIIFSIISFFVDTALYAKGLHILHVGNAIFVILCNCICFFSVLCIVKWYHPRLRKPSFSLLFVIAIMVIVELIQLNNVPRYDSNIYYGSLIHGIDLFNLDLITYIGAFNCWKWAQGLCLIIAPFEFLLYRKIIGVYIANILITIVTICILHWLLKQIYSSLTDTTASLYCFAFVFSPYIIGLFTYLDMDWHIAFFIIWLVAATIAGNDYLIAFLGFLLSFTKITGFAFYVFFLLTYALVEIASANNLTFFDSLRKWWSFKRVLLWLTPACMFLFILKYGEYLTSQSFYGTYVSDSMIKLFDVNQIMNTTLHTFVFGFRWILTLMMLVSPILYLIKKKIILNGKSSYIFIFYICFILMFILLTIYKSDANCPRYTTFFSAIYILLLPFFVDMIIPKKLVRTIFSIGISLLLFIQTFWTIDPSITLYADSIDTGVKKIYKLAYKNDNRAGMNLASGLSGQYPIMGDIYAYNLEYSYYDNLLQQTLSKMDFSENSDIFVLDISLYELNINGRNYGGGESYKIYWDEGNEKRTFVQSGNKLLNVKQVYTENILNTANNNLKFGTSFYLIVPSRVEHEDVISKFIDAGYELTIQENIKNIYGSLSLYSFSK